MENEDLVIQRHHGLKLSRKTLSKLTFGRLHVEEAEVVARNRVTWRHLSSQATGADIHDAASK